MTSVILRFKLYHIPFWIGYQLFWGALFNSENLLHWGTLVLILLVSAAEAVGAYANIYYLVPAFLRKKHYARYVLGFGVALLISVGLTILAYQMLFWGVTGRWTGVEEWFGGTKNFYGAIFTMAFTAMVVVMIIKLGKEWIKGQQRNQLLEKEKLETELKFLRSQFNPHFLFNTINSIHFLIQKDPAMASDTLSKFSDLLRYQLYECNEAHIPLQKEIHYLSNFVSLEKLRQNGNLTVSLEVSENINGTQIAPFILMPFVENAFKHVSRGKHRQHHIRICLQQQDHELHFHVENSKETRIITKKDVVYYGGIGLTNVKRRLDLLYPQQHTLHIDNQDDTYAVDLTLTLHEN